MSTATLPLAAVGEGGAQQSSAVAAAERVQQLQALITQVEHGPAAASSTGRAGSTSAASSTGRTGSTFAATLNAAQAGSSATEPSTDAYSAAAASPAATSSGGAAYAPLIEQAAARNGLDPAVLYGLIEQESGFDPSARSGAGALGLTQLMPSTAASLGVAEPLNPAQSIEGGARYLSQLLHQFAGNTADALAAYNAGPGAVQQYGGVPPYPETQQYVTKVLGYAASYQGGGIA
jgi:soluble lytic murein transglycosylase-like protein